MKVMSRMKPGDILLVLSVGILVLISLIWMDFHNEGKQSNRLIADITSNGEVIQKIDLNKVKGSETITVKNKGYELTLVAEKGKLRVLDADCPDKICVHAGWLKEQGDNAICMPSETIVMIEGEVK